ncbi:MAG TPA: hypothetical protein VFD92_16770 [Candidatus Binatia bacterium]|nr:hypothetical protein [Candidatus Binatia bacterium]
MSARAQGVQTSASLQVVPATAANLANNQTVQVTVFATNTSSDLAANSLPATVSGAITVTFGCTDCGCTAVDTQHLQFVPGGAGGCDTKDPAVTSCALMGTNDVVITLGSAISVPAAPNNKVQVAQFTLKAVNIDPNNPPGTLSIRGQTDICGVQACNQGACVQCEAQGCSRLNFGGGGGGNCPHLCPNKIIFKQNGPDFFEYHIIVTVPNGWDPNSAPFTLSLKNAMGELLNPQALFQLPANSFVAQSNVWTYSDPNAQNAGGIAFIKAAQRDNVPNAFRIDIQAYANGLQTNTTNPDKPTMTTTFSIGGSTFGPLTELWDRRTFGWQLNKH